MPSEYYCAHVNSKVLIKTSPWVSMDLARPHTAIVPTLDGEVLIVLAGTVRPLTGREVARLVKRGSQAGINRTLRRLVQHGLVEAQEAGAAILYSFNREHLAAPAVTALVDLRAELVRRLKESLHRWKTQPLHASLFGSAARGDGKTSSDIDVFLVRPSGIGENDPRWREQLERLAHDVHQWTGNQLGLAEVSKRELQRLRRIKPAVASALRRDAITLVGPPVSQLLGKAA